MTRARNPFRLMPIMLFFSACTLGPDFVKPEPPVVNSYVRGGEPAATLAAEGISQHFALGGKIAERWWRLFQSSALDRVVKEAIASNPGLQAAEANLRQSQASLQAGYGVFFPQLDAAFSPSRQRFSPARFGSSSSPTVFNLFTLTGSVSYVLDVFGAERRTVEGLEAQKDLQEYTALATYLTLTGNIINTVIAKAAYAAEVEATQQLIEILRQQIKLTKTQVQAGTVPYQNELTLRSQLNAVEATLPTLKQKISQTDDLQASLVGRTPAEWIPPEVKLAELILPADIPVSLPSELVRERPDILAAEAQLHSDSAKIGVSTAAMFPTISLSATYGYNNQNLPELFMNNSNLWSMAANFAQPIFHGGTLWFTRKAAIQAYEHSLDNYRQTVIGAFQQVADTLNALEHDAEAHQAQLDALRTSEISLGLINANYQAGLVNYLQVLTVDIQYQQARIAYLQALAQRFQDTVALFVALGGGWENSKDSILDGDRAGRDKSDGAEIDTHPASKTDMR